MKSTTMTEITRLDLQDLSTPSSASITNVKQLSSYNWIEAPTPTIAVPGCPPLWSTPKLSSRLRKDSGLIYIAQNAARHPESPLEPLFRSLYITNPSFEICSIDVVTDRNNIRKLLCFINPKLSRNAPETFTIKIEITKNTALFSRQETATSEYIESHQFRGYGHEFEKANTTSQIRDSTGHHRIISYHFGGLKFVVRYETDAYIGATADTTNPSNGDEQGNEDLSKMLGSLCLSSSSSVPDITPAESRLTIKEEGKVVPLDTTLEIKTRVSHKPLPLEEIIPQLWVSQTPKLVRAYHSKGLFREPKVEDMTADIKEWEEGNQKDLTKLAALMGRILSLVKGYGGNAILKYDEQGDKLIISKTDRKAMLPKCLYSKWESKDNPEVVAEGSRTPVEKVETKEGKIIENEGEDVGAGPDQKS